MASNEVKVDVDVRKAMQTHGPTIQLHVRGHGEWKVRLGLKIILLGAWIAGIRSEVETEE